ncbi:killer cell lectin-like receptor subfamily B member 1B allele A [Sander vitreus]
MSSNIYEDPNLTMDVKYSKGAREDGGESVERVIDIYESVDASTNRGVPTQRGGAHTQNHPPAVQRNPFRAAALVLGLLCLLLVVGVIVLANQYISVTLENNQLQNSTKELQTSYKELQTSYNNLSNSFCHTTHGWRRFQCSCYYKSTEMKTWTESKTDCQNRGADLVIIHSKDENDFVSELNKREGSWIGLQSVTTKDWKEEWKWMDESTLSYMSWQTDVNMNPVKGATVYMDLDGNWNHSNNGLKKWICEKHIHKV